MKQVLPLRYVNSAGEEIDLSLDGYKHDSPEMWGHKWSYNISKEAVSRFYKEPTERALGIWIDHWIAQEGIKRRNELFEMTEKDVRNNIPGTFHAGDYYCKGYVVGSVPSGYFADGRHMEVELRVLLPDPSWIADREFKFFIDNQAGSEAWLDFAFDFPFDFKGIAPTRSLISPVGYPSDFTMVIYGPSTNPLVQIGDNCYQVNVSLYKGERLIIASRTKRIYVIGTYGQVTDVFSKRIRAPIGSGNYIFEKVPVGISDVIVDNSFGFDLVIHEERSVPRWT